MAITSLDALHNTDIDPGDESPFTFDVVKRYIRHLAESTSDAHPDGPRFMPAAEYLDPATHDSDMAMLRRTPLVAAHCSQLPGPSTYATEELLGVPLLLVRQKDGTVKAFLNSCLHRGGRLADGAGPAKARFVCPYHAWSYRPDGQLANITDPDKFGAFDTSCRSLVEVACTERHGLIFVTLDPDGETDVDAFLGDFGPVLARSRLAEFEGYGQWPEPQPMNWKIAVSTYFESYHIKTVHSGTIGPVFVGNLSTHDAFGPSGQHLVTTWATQAIHEVVDLDDDALRTRLAAGAPYVKVLFLFPNVVITGDDAGKAFSHLIRIMPGTAPNEQLTDFRMVKRPDLGPETESFIEEFAKITLYALEEEDYATVQHTARALASGLQSGLYFGANEMSLTELHRNWAAAAGRPVPDQPVGG